MKVQLAVLADQANVAPPGKLNIMGIFDTIGAEKFPITLAFMVLAIRLKLEYEDREKTHELVISMQDEDGKEYINAKAKLKVEKVPPGETSHLNHILSFPGTRFSKPGKYAFRILWNGQEVDRVELRVTVQPLQASGT